MKIGHRHLKKSHIILVMVIFSTLVAYGFYLFSLFTWHSQLVKDRETVEMRLSRLITLYESRDDIKQRLASEEVQLTNFVYLSNRDASSISTQMQQQFRDILNQIGVETQGSQVMPLVEKEDYQRIRLHVRMSLELDQLEELLSLIYQQRPMLNVDQLQLQPVTVRGGESAQILNAQLFLSSIRLNL